ncbi:MAG: TlpA disulfide reductase family protein [Pseudomonadota bacterium]
MIRALALLLLGGVLAPVAAAQLLSDDIATIRWFEPVRQLPPLRVSGPDGETDIRSVLRPVTLIVMWGSWCHACAHEMPSLDRLQAKFAGRGLLVLPVAMFDQPFASRHFYRRFAIRHLPAFAASDEADWVPLTLADHYPTTLIVTGDGDWLGRHIGALQWDATPATELIEKLLTTAHAAPGPAPPVPK